jgi:hypothetical protein
LKLSLLCYNLTMATSRGSSNFYNIGNIPPQVLWTIVRGDTASFKVYVTNDQKDPLNIPDWTIEMQIKRPNSPQDSGKITDDATLILTLNPEADEDDLPGEFTVFLAANQSDILETGDIFDIELSLPQDQIVWTVAQGSVLVLEDVTD